VKVADTIQRLRNYMELYGSKSISASKTINIIFYGGSEIVCSYCKVKQTLECSVAVKKY